MQSNSHNPKICILLTATIDPKGVVFMKRSDPAVREKDHVDALRKWMQTEFPVVFSENSGYKIDRIENMAENSKKKNIEILQFDGQDFPREFGKGYGELLNIKHAVRHSKVINESSHVIKVNGRYFVKNIEEIASALSYSKDVYVMVDLQRNLTWADSRVFAFKPSFVFDYLSKFQDLLNDSAGIYMEHILSRAVLSAISEGHKWVPLPRRPIIVGYSGTSDTPYKKSGIRWVVGEIIHRAKNHLMERY